MFQGGSCHPAEERFCEVSHEQRCGMWRHKKDGSVCFQDISWSPFGIPSYRPVNPTSPPRGGRQRRTSRRLRTCRHRPSLGPPRETWLDRCCPRRRRTPCISRLLPGRAGYVRHGSNEAGWRV